MPEGVILSICRNCTTNCQSLLHRRYFSDDDGALAIGLAEIALTGMFRDVFEYSSEGLALIIRTIGIADEIEEHLLLFQHDFLDTQLFARHTKGHHIDEFFGHIRDGAKTVDQPFAVGLQVIVEVVAVSEIVELAIEQHTFGIAGDILIREVHLDIGIEGAIVDKGEWRVESGEWRICYRCS